MSDYVPGHLFSSNPPPIQFLFNVQYLQRRDRDRNNNNNIEPNRNPPNNVNQYDLEQPFPPEIHYENVNHPPTPEIRRPCCSFCYGTRKSECEKTGEKVPEKDDDGPWSYHSLKRDGKVTCPVLQKVVCQICGKTGEEAHTTNHCPERENYILRYSRDYVHNC